MDLESGIRDPGSEIRDPEKTYSGSQIQGSKRHRIPDPDPQHCKIYKLNSNNIVGKILLLECLFSFGYRWVCFHFVTGGFVFIL
jgi:hypothetical protein